MGESNNLVSGISTQNDSIAAAVMKERSEAESLKTAVGVVVNFLWMRLNKPIVIGVGILVLTWLVMRRSCLYLRHVLKCCQRRCFRTPFQKNSIDQKVDLMEYAVREWKGTTEAAKLMKKGYREVYKNHNIKHIRRVRGDNYCALRATLFQVLIRGLPLPTWIKEQDIVKIPEKLLYSQGCNWIQQYSFGPEKYTGINAFGKLRKCLEMLKSQWNEMNSIRDQEKREEMCKVLFSDEDKEYKLYEAVKFLMLYLVIEFYEEMKNGGNFPGFVTFLFARDTSSDPLSFMMNHLNHIGDTGGLEQIEMFLLGYSLELKIRVFRISKYKTEEFQSIYPEEYGREWQEVILLTEDDRHYNIPVIAK
ncbi:inactive ubiquitin thioesterase OTULINL isoform X1 [Protopterus annectens]|uniref:inactive ubiquitin thioesterase OTULINL isoform X1 n=1 Tax=Protopterus annectens TaxID=7888 RepID=UPI001CF9DCE0|nr:inactive ubiquitin thioesterase OTULINL isoform X1 [Protopterus annectens]